MSAARAAPGPGGDLRPEGPGRPRLRRLLALGLLLSAALSVFAVLGGGFGTQVSGDLYSMFVPRYRYAAESLAQGRLPLWNPYEFAGIPFHAMAQAGVLYLPTALAYLTLEPAFAIRVLYHVHLAAYVLLLVVYLARSGIEVPGALTGALLAAGCFFNAMLGIGADHPSMLFSMPFFVGGLAALDAAIRGRTGLVALLALLCGIQWLPGYPVLSADMALLLLLVALLSPGQTALRRLAIALVALAVGALLAGAQLVPLYEASVESARADWMDRFPLGRALFSVFGVRYFFASLLDRYGAAGFFLIALGLLSPQRLRLAWVAALASCVFSMNWPLSLLYELPVLKMQQNAFGWDVLEALFAGLVAGAGLERLRRPGAGRPALIASGLGAALAAVGLAIGSAPAAGTAALCAVLAWPSLARRGAWLGVSALAAVHVGGVMLHVESGKNARPDFAVLEKQAETLEALGGPDLPRVLSAAGVREGLALGERLPSPSGYEPALPPLRSYRLVKQMGLWIFDLNNRWPRAAAFALADHPGAGAALGIGLVVASPEDAVPFVRAGFARRARLPDGSLALSRAAAPRFQILHAARTAADERESLRMILAPDFDPTREVILEEPGVALGSVPPLGGAAELGRIVSDEPEHIRLRTRLSSPGVLVVADTWYPGWTASVDGAPAPILRANYAFRAVPLPPGAREVELRYRPLSFTLGCVTSGAGVLLLLALAGWSRRAPPSRSA